MLTTFAPILIRLTRSIVNYQCSPSSGSAHVSCGSKAAVGEARSVTYQGV